MGDKKRAKDGTPRAADPQQDAAGNWYCPVCRHDSGFKSKMAVLGHLRSCRPSKPEAPAIESAQSFTPRSSYTEKRDVLDRLSGWGFGSLKQMVTAGRAAANNGVWGLNINAAKGEDANRISAAYSALWANAPMLLEIVEELAQEVREWRAKPKEIDEVGGVRVYASGRLARELEGAKAEVAKLKAAFPAELEGCTLVYRQCGRGHGDITATNWVQHACPTCALDDAKAERDHWKNLAARAIAARDVAQAQSAEFQVDIARYRAGKAVSDE